MSDLLYINTDSSETVKKIMEADIPIPAAIMLDEIKDEKLRGLFCLSLAFVSYYKSKKFYIPQLALLKIGVSGEEEITKLAEEAVKMTVPLTLITELVKEKTSVNMDVYSGIKFARYRHQYPSGEKNIETLGIKGEITKQLAIVLSKFQGYEGLR